MPKLTHLQSNFTAGVLSPRIMARVDVGKYFNGLEQGENIIVLPEGGVSRRPGLRFVAEVKDSASPVRLFPFIFSQGQSYVLEVGDNYLRFFTNHGQVMDGAVPYEIASPFTLEEWLATSRTQSADTVFLAHKNKVPGKLIRRGHTDWAFQNISHRPGAVKVRRHDSAETLSLSGITGYGLTATVSGPFWLPGDVGRLIISGSGRGVITAWISNLQVTFDVIDDFASAGPIAPADWYLEGSPSGEIDLPHSVAKKNGVGVISAHPGTGDLFRTGDVGCYLTAEEGFFLITGYIDPQHVNVRTLKAPEEYSGSTSTYLWDMWEDAWKANNYPEMVALHNNRLIYGGWPQQPLSLAGSKVGDFNDFILGSKDADAVNFTLAADQIDALLWMVSETGLILGSPGGIWSVVGKDGPLSPTAPPDARLQPKVGAAALAPVAAGSVLLFIQASRRKVRELVYNYEIDRFVAPDLTRLSEHITKPGIKELAYAAEPVSMLWAMREDGVVSAMTYEREEQVVAWTEAIKTQGEVESGVVIPYGDRNELWVVVKRTINGQVKRYIEYLESFELPQTPEDWFFVDSGLTYSGPPVTVISGAEHLAGEEVAVLVDGAMHPNCLVGSAPPNVGKFNLNYPGSKVQFGLPYTSWGRTVRLEVGGELGTVQGKIKRVVGAMLRFYRSAGCEIGEDLNNMEELFWRHSSTPMGTPEPEYTGDIPADGTFRPFRGDYGPAAQIYFRQSKPLPMTLLGIVAEVEVAV